MKKPRRRSKQVGTVEWVNFPNPDQWKKVVRAIARMLAREDHERAINNTKRPRKRNVKPRLVKKVEKSAPNPGSVIGSPKTLKKAR